MSIDTKTVDFDKEHGLVPAIVQHYRRGTVLMLGFMNREALEQSERDGRVTFFSRTKGRLWTKGESSGNFLIIKEIRLDCDRDTVLIKAQPTGPVCHTGAETCFAEEESAYAFLDRLVELIRSRKADRQGDSYVSKLFAEGLNRVAQKFGEEAIETVIEAKDYDRERFISEAADLFFHYLVLLEAKEVELGDVLALLASRNKTTAKTS